MPKVLKKKQKLTKIWNMTVEHDNKMTMFVENYLAGSSKFSCWLKAQHSEN